MDGRERVFDMIIFSAHVVMSDRDSSTFGIGLRRRRAPVEVRVPHVRWCFECGGDATAFCLLRAQLLAKEVMKRSVLRGFTKIFGYDLCTRGVCNTMFRAVL